MPSPPSARGVRTAGVAGGLLAGGLAAALVGCAGDGPSPAGSGPLLVSAAASLSGPLQTLAVPFARGSGRPAPRFNFGSSGLLRQQIRLGAPADVVLVAGARPMDDLQRAGLLLPGSRRDLLGNRLVLVVPERAPRRPLGFAGLAGPGVERIAIGDGTVPAGDYARQVLAHHGLTERRGAEAGAAGLGAGRGPGGGGRRRGRRHGVPQRRGAAGRPAGGGDGPGGQPRADPLQRRGAAQRAAGRGRPRPTCARWPTPAARAVFRRDGFEPLREGSR